MADEEKTSKLEKQKMLIETLKWFITSVLIVVIALIVDSNFKKRDLMLRELDQYDKFIDLLTAHDPTIGAQYKLACFYDKFSVSKDFRTVWDNYITELKIEYDAYNEELKNTNTNIENIVLKPDKTDFDLSQLENLEMKKEILERELSDEFKVSSGTKDKAEQKDLTISLQTEDTKKKDKSNLTKDDETKQKEQSKINKSDLPKKESLKIESPKSEFKIKKEIKEEVDKKILLKKNLPDKKEIIDMKK